MEIESIYNLEILSIWSNILDAIIYGIQYVAWLTFVSGPLFILSGLSPVIEFIATGLIGKIIFGNSWDNNKAFSFDRSDNIIATVFTNLFMISTPLWLVLLGFNYISYTLKVGDATIGEKWKKSLIGSFKGLAFFIFVPLIFWLLSVMASEFARAIGIAFGINDKNDLPTIIYLVGNSKWNGTKTDNEWSYAWNKVVYDGFTPPDMQNMKNYNIFITILTALFTMFCILLLAIGIMIKIIELVFYLMIFPFIAVAMIRGEQGEEYFKIWSQSIFGKFLTITFSMLSFYIFLTLLMVFVGIAATEEIFQGTAIEQIAIRNAFLVTSVIACSFFTILSEKEIAKFTGDTGGLISSALSMVSKASMVAGKVTRGIGKAGRFASKAVGMAGDAGRMGGRGLKAAAFGTEGGNQRRQQRSDEFEREENSSLGGIDNNKANLMNNSGASSIFSKHPVANYAKKQISKSIANSRTSRPSKFTTKGGVYGKVANTISGIDYLNKSGRYNKMVKSARAKTEKINSKVSSNIQKAKTIRDDRVKRLDKDLKYSKISKENYDKQKTLADNAYKKAEQNQQKYQRKLTNKLKPKIDDLKGQNWKDWKNKNKKK